MASLRVASTPHGPISHFLTVLQEDAQTVWCQKSFQNQTKTKQTKTNKQKKKPTKVDNDPLWARHMTEEVGQAIVL